MNRFTAVFMARAGLALLLVAVYPALASAQDLKKVAVLDFAARGVSAEVAANVADVVAVELSNVEGFSVISKKDISAMVGFEQDRQMLGCDDDQCISEIGSALGVHYIVTGSVGLLGEKITLALSMVDIQKGTPFGRAQEEVGELGALPGAARRAVKNMIGGKRVIRKLAGKGGVFVASSPEGATVYLDGSPQAGGTPLNIKDVSAGDHMIKIVKGDLEREAPVLVEPDKIAKISLSLAVVRARFLSVPFDAKVFIDGIERGTTPLLIADVSAERHRVEYRKAGYKPHIEEVLFELTAFRKAGGEAIEIKADLRPEPVTLIVKSIPSGAEVLLDGDEKGETPLEIPNVLPGHRVVVVRKKGYKNEERKFTIKPAEKPEVSVTLPEFITHKDYMGATSARRTLTTVGLIAGGIAVVAGVGLTAGGWITNGQAQNKKDDQSAVQLEYSREMDPVRIAALKADYSSIGADIDDLNKAANIEAGLGYGLMGAGGAVLLGVLINALTMPTEPDYDKNQELVPGGPAAPAAPTAPKAGAAVVPGGGLLTLRGVF